MTFSFNKKDSLRRSSVCIAAVALLILSLNTRALALSCEFPTDDVFVQLENSHLISGFAVSYISSQDHCRTRPIVKELEDVQKAEALNSILENNLSDGLFHIKSHYRGSFLRDHNTNPILINTITDTPSIDVLKNKWRTVEASAVRSMNHRNTLFYAVVIGALVLSFVSTYFFKLRFFSKNKRSVLQLSIRIQYFLFFSILILKILKSMSGNKYNSTLLLLSLVYIAINTFYLFLKRSSLTTNAD